YSWVLRGKQRKLVVKHLDKPKIPSQLKKDCDLAISHISKILKELVSKNIVECLTPKIHMGRIYRLTKKGEFIRKELI
ncbi:unnamed protein product, partial [marine sediment metagenome]